MSKFRAELTVEVHSMYMISKDCVECGACMSECPADAIVEGSPYKITDACTDCGACAEACPVDAISPA